jgi:hypothetical protein
MRESPRRSPHFCGDSKTRSPHVKSIPVMELARFAGTAGTFSVGRSHVRARVNVCGREIYVCVFFLESGKGEKSPQSPQKSLCL